MNSIFTAPTVAASLLRYRYRYVPMLVHLEKLECLLSYQFILLVPFHGPHDALPQLGEIRIHSV